MSVATSSSGTTTGPSRPTIWFEVEDFLEHFDRTPKPAGIQRVQMEIFSILNKGRETAREIRFCRLNRFSQRFEVIDSEFLLRTFDNPPLKYAAPRLVPDRNHLASWLVHEREKFRTTRQQFYLRVVRMFPWLLPLSWPRALTMQSRGPFNPGDILVCLGMSWWNIYYIDRVARMKRIFDLRFVVLVHDVIPVTDPEWMTPDAAVVFRHWVLGVLEHADLVLAVSNYSRLALVDYAKRQGLPVPPTETIRLGTGFHAEDVAAPRADIIERLPSSYALFVSTLEPRKNHRLLVRLWRHLIERHGAANVPSLVFVGQRGWMVEDLLVELVESRYLDGKIVLYSDLSDAELKEIYRRCLFSVYPSVLEGFGLPVAESLEQGKLCVASRRAAIPEVGGELVDYIDPDNEVATLAVLERAIFDQAYRSAREAQIRAEYRPTTWTRCVEVLLENLDRLSRNSADARDMVAAPMLRPLNIEGASR
jgi:glycosyltransferase involved in cell wall biosynthesis